MFKMTLEIKIYNKNLLHFGSALWYLDVPIMGTDTTSR